MDTAKELCMMITREKEARATIRRNRGNSSLGAVSWGSRTRYSARSS